VSDPFFDVDGLVIAPIECDECGRTIYVKAERLRDEDFSLTCAEHT